MSTHLPENPAEWPRDPFALLGVEMPISAKDLKRAYVRLIRKYKPEHHPDEFRRIRDAYEQAERILPTAEMYAPEFEAPVEPDASDAEESADFLAQMGKQLQNRTFRNAIPDVYDQVEEYWTLAREGELQAAYDKLRALEQQHLGDVDLCHRLYWLLKVAPELDASRSASDWLLHSMRSVGNSHSSLVHLYRRELISQPSEALGPKCQQLLPYIESASTVRDLLNWRWQACWSSSFATYGQQIEADLNLLRKDLRDRSEVGWASILMLAADFLAWSQDESTFTLWEDICEEVQQYDYLADQLSDEFYRLDFLKELALEWQIQYQTPGDNQELLNLIPVSWVQPDEVYKPQLMALLHRASKLPNRTLLALDQLREQAPLLVGQFCLILRYQEHTTTEDPEIHQQSELVDRLVWRMLDATWRLGYMHWREKLLKFVTEEFIMLDQIENAMTRYPEASLTTDQAYLIQHRIEALYEDSSLRAVCLAHRFFYS